MINKTLLKTASYAGMHMFNAIMVAYLLSSSWKVALAIGLVEPAVQTVGYFFHERAWHRWETRHHKKDPHNSVIDSVSPAGSMIEKVLRRKS